MTAPIAQIAPFPWKQGGARGELVDDASGHVVIDLDIGPRRTVPEDKALAAFIVRACNAHEKMVEALEDAKAELQATYDVHLWASTKIALDNIAAALALAKGETR